MRRYVKRRKAELYRNVEQGKVAGICAGLADYFGWETWLVRILMVSGVLFGLPFLLLGYIAAWFILDKAPEKQSTSEQEPSYRYNPQSEVDYDKNESIKVKARIWQAGEPPKKALYDIRRKFNSLEKKVQAMEHYVTSSEFTVAREINKL